MYASATLFVILGLASMGDRIILLLQELEREFIEQQDIIMYIVWVLFYLLLVLGVYFITLKGVLWAKGIVVTLFFYEAITEEITVLEHFTLNQTFDGVYLHMVYFGMYLLLGMFLIMSKYINVYIDNYGKVLGADLGKDYSALLNQIELVLQDLKKRLNQDKNNKVILSLFEQYTKAKENILKKDTYDIGIRDGSMVYEKFYTDYNNPMLINMKKAESMLESIQYLSRTSYYESNSI